MPYFSYKAVDRNGEHIKGGIESESADSVRKYLSMSGFITVDVQKMRFWNMDLADIGILKKNLSKKEIAYACRQIAYVLRSGLSMSAGFDVIIDNTPNSNTRKRFTSIKADILRGDSIGSCMRKTGAFPAFLCSMADVGERTDSLDIIMQNMADFYENDAKVSSQISAMLVYPAFIAVVMLVVVVAALIYVVPSYAAVFSEAGAALPLPTRVLIAMSIFFVNNHLILLGTIFAVAFLFMILLRTPWGGYAKDWLWLRNPITGNFNIKSMNLYFAESMNILLVSRADVLSSLKTAKGVLGNNVYDKQLDRVIERVRSGARLGDALSGSVFFCGILRAMIGLGEDTDKLPETLFECSKFLKEELDASVNRLKSLIQPITTIILGLILGFIVLATMLPSIQTTSFF